MVYSIQREVSDGTLQTLTLRITYFKKTHISVYVDDKLADGSAGRYSWVWDGDRIRLNAVVPVGIEVMIRRKTPMDTPFHNFRQGAVFKDVTMDENFIQQLYINQENVEGLSATDFYSDLDLHNYRMKNVGTAISDADAVSLGQYRADALGANQYRILAEASKVAAKVSETNTKASELAAKLAALEAKNSEVAAKGASIEATTAAHVATEATSNALVAEAAAKVSELEAKKAAELASQYNGLFTQAGAGAVTRTAQDKMREVVSVKDFKCADGLPVQGDGVHDDTTGINAAIAAVGDNDTLMFPKGTYKVSSIISLPMNIDGNFTIAGSVKWGYKKHPTQQGHMHVTGSVTIDSIWFSKFNFISADGDVTLCSSNSTWGTFWNDFGKVHCAKLILDVDQGQSVNQNNFQSCKCSSGIHIKGTATSGVREAHNNIFIAVDTTGATGDHLVNDSTLNQTNTVLNWYAEGSGTRRVVGNWNIMGSNVDSNGGINATTDRNSYLFSGTTIESNNADYLAASTTNLIVGGSMDVFGTDGYPLGMRPFGTFAGTGAVLAAETCPSGIPRSMSIETSSSFSGIGLRTNLKTPTPVVVTMWYAGDDIAMVEAGVTYTSVGVYKHPSGWKLGRFVVPAATDDIKLYLNSSGTGYKRITICGVHATSSKVGLLPSPNMSGEIQVRGGASGVAAGALFTIPINTGTGYFARQSGVVDIDIFCPETPPSFAGYLAKITSTYTKIRTNNTDNVVILGAVSKSVSNINTSGKDVVVTGSTEGITLQLPAGVGASTLSYKLTSNA